MRFVIFGAGAIGGVIGARLAQSGREVVLVARGAHLEAIRARGLRIESAGGSATVALPAVGDPAAAALRAEDVVLLATKSQDTAAALQALRAAAPDEIALVCAQNGVANERAAARLFPRVYAMCVMCPTGHLEPGVVQAYSSPTTGILDLGCYPAGVDGVAREVAAALSAASAPGPTLACASTACSGCSGAASGGVVVGVSCAGCCAIALCYQLGKRQRSGNPPGARGLGARAL